VFIVVTMGAVFKSGSNFHRLLISQHMTLPSLFDSSVEVISAHIYICTTSETYSLILSFTLYFCLCKDHVASLLIPSIPLYNTGFHSFRKSYHHTKIASSPYCCIFTMFTGIVETIGG
jgi:hypothetical protein